MPEIALDSLAAKGEGDSERRSGFTIQGSTEVALVATICAGIAIWIVPIASSLWLDETGTFWVIKDGLRTTLSRSLAVQGQSPFYYITSSSPCISAARTRQRSGSLL